jgi:hypothetical protein
MPKIPKQIIRHLCCKCLLHRDPEQVFGDAAIEEGSCMKIWAVVLGVTGVFGCQMQSDNASDTKSEAADKDLRYLCTKYFNDGDKQTPGQTLLVDLSSDNYVEPFHAPDPTENYTIRLSMNRMIEESSSTRPGEAGRFELRGLADSQIEVSIRHNLTQSGAATRVLKSDSQKFYLRVDMPTESPIDPAKSIEVICKKNPRV